MISAPPNLRKEHISTAPGHQEAEEGHKKESRFRQYH